MKTKSFNTVKSLVTGLVFVTSMLLMNSSFAADEPGKKGDVGRGAKAWVDNCTRCHNTRDPKELRDDQWITTSFHMRIRAGLTGQETRDIIAFLQMSN